MTDVTALSQLERARAAVFAPESSGRTTRVRASCAVACAALLMSACAGGTALLGPSLGTVIGGPTAASTGSLSTPASQPAGPVPAAPSKAPTLAVGNVPVPAESSPGGPTLGLGFNLSHVEAPPLTVYASIVKGTRGCWFGQDGVLAESHILYADARPAEKGGDVVITINNRVVNAPSIWGARAMEIKLQPSGAGTDVSIDTLRLPPAMAGAMRGDLQAWMYDKPGCNLRAAGSAVPQAAPPLPVRRPAPPKRRRAGKRATAKG